MDKQGIKKLFRSRPNRNICLICGDLRCACYRECDNSVGLASIAGICASCEFDLSERIGEIAQRNDQEVFKRVGFTVSKKKHKQNINNVIDYLIYACLEQGGSLAE